MRHGTIRPEGFEIEASKGALCPFGGFFILRGDPMSAESFKRKLTAYIRNQETNESIEDVYDSDLSDPF